MKLTNEQLDELERLCELQIEDRLEDADSDRLANYLRDSEAARRYYVKRVGLSAHIYDYANEVDLQKAGEAFALRTRSSQPWWRGVWGLAAACLALGLGYLAFDFAALGGQAGKSASPPDYVARVTGGRDARWHPLGARAEVGDYLEEGRRLRLDSGFVEVTFDSGALLTLEGPADMTVGSAWYASLKEGAVKADVPPQAIGFRLSNPSVEIVDLGTSFSLIADGSGKADVMVLDGKIEASPRFGSDRNAILMNQHESRQFSSDGVAFSRRDEQSFARFPEPLSLQRAIARSGQFARWPFDSVNSLWEAFGVDSQGLGDSFSFSLFEVGESATSDTAKEGRFGGAVSFDGQRVAFAQFDGLSSQKAHSVSFWVKVPKDAPLSNAYAMVAWWSMNEVLGARPVHISWNRNPSEGPLGALRTDFRGGYSIAATSLRDGRWHHVAVVFVPGRTASSPAHVKQYVDGRLESNIAVVSEMKGSIRELQTEKMRSLNDLVWIGTRLGSSGPSKSRFMGLIDELVITDGWLAPSEIVALSRGELPQLELAALPE